MSDPVFYQPEGAWLGDVIPVYRDGQFWLFHLVDHRDGRGVGWELVRTRDFVHVEKAGTAIPSGGPDAADFNVWTGSVVWDGDRHHLFYTGNNPRWIDERTDTSLQHVMHATSEDGMRTWDKHPEDTFGAPVEGYERCDWRDPFVFQVEDGTWRMLLAARRDHGPDRRRGLIAQCASTDLKTWEVVQPFWDPRRYATHECPDLFSHGDRWYLVFSEFSDRFVTAYRTAARREGPWVTPRFDSMDGRAFYAAKTVSGEGRRFAIGWIPSKEGEADDGSWQWAGAMAVHEVQVQPDGSLGFGLPREVRESFSRAVELELRPVEGSWTVSGAGVRRNAAGSRAVLATQEIPSQFYLALRFEMDPGCRDLSVGLRYDAERDEGYFVRIEPDAQRMVFDRWPRRRTGPGQWQISGDVPHVVELERPVELGAGEHTLEIVADGTAMVAYLDERFAMSARIYDRSGGAAALIVDDGAVSVLSWELRVRDF